MDKYFSTYKLYFIFIIKNLCYHTKLIIDNFFKIIVKFNLEIRIENV